MPEQIKKIMTPIMVIVGISFSLMMVAIFVAAAWKVMNSACLVG